MAAEDGVDGRPQRFGVIDDEQHLAVGIDAAGHDVFQQSGRYRRVFRGAFADAQHMFIAFHIQTHHADHGVVAEQESLDVSHQQFQVVKPPAEQGLHLGVVAY
jgi:hypothetical protein